MSLKDVKNKMNRIKNQLIYLSESSLSMKVLYLHLGKNQYFQEIQYLDKIIDFCTKEIQEINLKFN
jgi:hypothetical protein